MPPAVNALTTTRPPKPCVLVVDDEPGMLELLGDVVSREIDCRILSARNLNEARSLLNREAVELLVADVNLPDGNGMSLLTALREKRPSAGAMVITGSPSLEGAIAAMRAGVIDFVPKPFSATAIAERVRYALRRQQAIVKTEHRLTRLRSTVKRLNVSRRMVSKKVDLLCNDLVAAYGELSRQLDDVRIQEGYRKLADSSKDLEQLLCHTMDWILRHSGYCNVAIWLAADDGEFELGAYMKYTIAGEKPFTESMKKGLLPMLTKESFIHLEPEDHRDHLSDDECNHLNGQSIMGVNCTYLGESLAAVLVFRDQRSPFSDADAVMLKTISPLFAVALASSVRKAEGDIDDTPFNDGGLIDDDDRDRKRRKPRDRDNTSAADWWKRGEPPPF